MIRPQVIAEATERFPGDVAGHEIMILQDSGLYRHIRFKNPASSHYWFELVTWPGHLAIDGDMGCYGFSREHDMFSWFRGGREEYDYWAGKVIAGGRLPKEYSPDRVRETVMDWAREFDADGERDHTNFVRRNQSMADIMANELHDIDLEDEAETKRRLADFSYKDENMRKIYPFSYLGDWDFTDFRFHFIWCCLAITWGISEYDKYRLQREKVLAGVESPYRRLIRKLMGRRL